MKFFEFYQKGMHGTFHIFCMKLQQHKNLKIKILRLLNCLPCMLTCSCANVPCMLTCSYARMPLCIVCLHAIVPCVLMCSRANVPSLLMCSCSNVSCILMCSHANVPCVHMHSCANVLFVLPCSGANAPWVITSRTCQHDLHAYVLTCLCGLQAHVVIYQHVLSSFPHTAYVTLWSPANMLCLISTSCWCHFFQFHCHCCWSCRHLVRFKSLINVFLL